MVYAYWSCGKLAPENQNLFEGKIVDEVFIANTNIYKFCGVEILPSFSCYDVIKNADVENDLNSIWIVFFNLTKRF